VHTAWETQLYVGEHYMYWAWWLGLCSLTWQRIGTRNEPSVSIKRPGIAWQSEQLLACEEGLIRELLLLSYVRLGALKINLELLQGERERTKQLKAFLGSLSGQPTTSRNYCFVQKNIQSQQHLVVMLIVYRLYGFTLLHSKFGLGRKIDYSEYRLPVLVRVP
jgi:hypothetical protein